ncbi:GIY-YIG nuclease family protein [Streptomyces cylindrosporus]|uniref:GIY-YIG nuclease family protein n=1 Tax=Streptomyces cylindrosporus TaxID=2927583 RepID=A0ABS9YPD1_9ACTN|nr:GIY-YIG nuclease family protein [Streptomyces cylindrosporus]MCI3279127.1 GIY-YIG nuclease family protein [Streptomyces cylindrosporus]
MGQTFSVHIDVAGHRIPGTWWAWGGATQGGERSESPSYGTEVEVPAVIELLDLVVAGAVSAEEARNVLNHIATTINEKMRDGYSKYLSFDELDDQTEDAPQQPKQPAPAPTLDERWVYAVSSETDPRAIKIGVATDIPRRLRSLQVGCPSPILLRWSERGGYPLERHLHNTFADRRISGEWFDFRDVADPVKEIDAAARAFLRQFEGDEPDAA